MSNNPYTVTRQPEPEDWHQEALCRGADTDIFYPPERDAAAMRQAKAICAACPVSEPCGAEGLANRERGVWGGMSDRQRDRINGKPTRIQKLPSERKPPTERRGCGTPSGHVAHYRAGEKACQRCLIAHRADRRGR